MRIKYLEEEAVEVLHLVVAQPQGLHRRAPGAVHRQRQEAVAVQDQRPDVRESVQPSQSKIRMQMPFEMFTKGYRQVGRWAPRAQERAQEAISTRF